MKLRSIDEGELIAAIRKEFPSSDPQTLRGIGDDVAVIKSGAGLLLLTKDLLVEGVHFRRSFHPPHLLGRKSLNVNISDIAAVGGKPRYALLGLGLPARIETDWVEEFFNGMKSAARDAGVELIGGDLTRAVKVFISLSLLGEIGKGHKPVFRNGAGAGDGIYVSGTVGDAHQGLLLLKNGVRFGKDTEKDTLIRRFLDPRPQLSLGRALSAGGLASSMIDMSDGLSVDLGHVCRESGCGADVYHEKLPLSAELRSCSQRPIWVALHGGEDYQLLFTVPRKKEPLLTKLRRKHRITLIGWIKKEKGVFEISFRGRKKPLLPKGFRHF